MADKQPTRVDAMPNDVGEWGEKDTTGAYDSPLSIAGESVNLDSLPAFGSTEKAASQRAPVRAA